MANSYQEHCVRAFKLYGDHVYATLCTEDHFNHWLREQKASDSKDCSHVPYRVTSHNWKFYMLILFIFFVINSHGLSRAFYPTLSEYFLFQDGRKRKDAGGGKAGFHGAFDFKKSFSGEHHMFLSFIQCKLQLVFLSDHHHGNCNR